MIKQQVISILGCGWFGHPLAKELVAAGYTIKGSTTSPEKLAILESDGIEAHLLDLSDSSLPAGSFFDSEILIVGVPPRMRTEKEDNYTEKISRLAELLKGSNVKQLIFISSTSVFSDTNGVVDENTPPAPESASSAAILSAERLLLSCSWFKTTIVRFAGLIGPNREPGRFFAGKTGIPNGKAAANLIHLDDCLGIVKTILDKEAFGNVFHAVAPQHPSKASFYTHAAIKAGLAVPEFRDELISWKIVESVNVPLLLNYTFKRKIADKS